MRKILGGALGVLLALTASASAAEVRVFVGGAITGPLRDIGAAFSAKTGNTVTVISDTTGSIQKRLRAGEKADLVVVTSTAVDALQKENILSANGRADLARALIGVGIRAGAKAPDISTPDSFKAALLAARTVSYVDPAAGGTSGTYFEGLMAKMGIAEAMKPKIVYRNQGSEVADAVAKGDAEIGITFGAEMLPNKGVTVVGPLPDAIQLPTTYTAAVTTSSASGEAAKGLIAALSADAGRAAIAKAGMEPLGKR